MQMPSFDVSGMRVTRLEDPRLLTGRGRFAQDWNAPDAFWKPPSAASRSPFGSAAGSSPAATNAWMASAVEFASPVSGGKFVA